MFEIEPGVGLIGLTGQILLFLAPLAYSPGPGNITFAANGACFGFKSTLTANLGYHVATFVMTFLIGLGFEALTQGLEQFYDGLRLAGSCYILYLAYRLYTAQPVATDITANSLGFWDGVMLLILNPKAYLIILVLLSQFLTKAQSEITWFVLYISIVFTLNNLVAFTIWTLAGDRLIAAWCHRDKRQHLNRWFGMLLSFIAIWLLFS